MDKICTVFKFQDTTYFELNWAYLTTVDNIVYIKIRRGKMPVSYTSDCFQSFSETIIILSAYRASK